MNWTLDVVFEYCAIGACVSVMFLALTAAGFFLGEIADRRRTRRGPSPRPRS